MKKTLFLLISTLIFIFAFSSDLSSYDNNKDIEGTSPNEMMKKPPATSSKAQIWYEGFENDFLPSGWQMYDMPGAVVLSATGIPWHQITGYTYEGSMSLAYGHALNVDNRLSLPRLDLSGPMDSVYLSFWWAGSYSYAVTIGFLSLKLEVSQDDGATWDTLYDNHDSASVVNHGGTWPYTNWAWYNPHIDLSAYKGDDDLLVSLHLNADSGADIYLDAVSLDTALVYPLDIYMSQILAPATTAEVAINQSMTPACEVFNVYGDSIEARFGVVIQKDSVVVHSELTPLIKLPGRVYYYPTFSSWSGPTEPGDYEFIFFTRMEDDEVPSNDTLSVTYTAYPKWKTISNTNYPIQWPGYCTDGDKLYVIGGMGTAAQGGAVQNYVQSYDPATDTWEVITNTPYPVSMAAAAIIDSVLYITNLDASANIDFVADSMNMAYDMRTGMWDFKTPCPYNMIGSAGGVVDNKMYIVGGLNNGSFSTEAYTYEYNPAADTSGGTPWTRMTDCPRAGIQLGGAFYGAPGNDHVIIGGDYRGSDTTYAYYIYTPSADTTGGTPWTKMSFPDFASAGGAGGKTPMLVWDNDYAYLVGGDYYGNWGGFYSSQYGIYDIASDSWSIGLYTLNTVREGGPGAIINNRIYFYGGTIGSNAITPAPFEFTYTVQGMTGDTICPYISSSNPADCDVVDNMEMDIIINFNEAIDYNNYPFSYTITPDPGNVNHSWNGGNDILTLTHTDFQYNVTYTVDVSSAFDNTGNMIDDNNSWFSFSTSVNFAGNRISNEFSPEINSIVTGQTAQFKLAGDFPEVSFDIYDISGKYVTSIGYNSNFRWNLNEHNHRIANGIYFWRTVHNGKLHSGKITVIR